MPKANTAQDEADEMFGTNGASNDGDFADVDDLLNQVEEDDAEGWVPTEPGEGIAGTLLKIGETRSDFAPDGQDPMVPTWTIETRDGNFRVIGYGAVLKREITDSTAKVGDKVAVKFFGEKILKKGKFAGRPYKHFGIAHRPA